MSDSIVELARKAIVDYRARQDSGDAHVVHFPAPAVLELHRCAILAAKDRVLQAMPFDPISWNPDGFEHTIWRQAAEAGLTVARLYVLPHRGVARHSVDRQLQLDRDAGIEARIIFLSNIPEGSRAVVPDGLWLVDRESVVTSRILPGTNSDAVWSVSERGADLAHGKASWEQLWSWSEDPEHPSEPPVELEEPLVLSADLVHGVADVLCTSDHVDRESCAWYHGSWQYLRLLNLVSTPTWHSEFYLQELEAALSESRQPRAIITGAADYSMLAYVDASTHREGPLQVDVLDLCPTPLFSCRWYAKRVGRRITTLEHDLLNAPPELTDERYDLVCSDAFLTRFSREQVRDVATTWARCVRPGGRLVTTVRVHPRSPAARDAEEEIRDFRERAEQRAARWRPFLRRTPTEIGQLAETYARRMKSTDLGREDQIHDELTTAGFEIRRRELADVPGELRPTTYARLVCQKRTAS